MTDFDGAKNVSSEDFGANIARQRVNMGLTQASLAQKLGVTHQAVSQWECGDTMPDITLLPRLAATLGVTIDSLFSAGTDSGDSEEKLTHAIAHGDLPADDGKLRAVLFIGKKPVKSQQIVQNLVNENRIVFKYKGPALNVESHMSLECGNVEGNAIAGHSLKCGDIRGYASAGHGMNCQNIGQYATSGHGMNVNGDIGGDAKAGHAINCNNVNGNVKAGHSVIVKGSVGGSIDGKRV